jgi:hypothetical protein
MDMLEHYGLANSKPASTPIDPGLELSIFMAPQNEDEVSFLQSVPYINAVNSLMYLATSM